MAYEPLIKDEPDEQPAQEPAQPDPMAAVQAQLADMNERINAAYQANKGMQPAQPQPQYIPYPVYQQQEEDNGYSEADILADLPGTLERIRQEAAQEAEQRIREDLGQHLSRVYEKDFERDFRDLAQMPHFKFVENELKEHFEKNPGEKYMPGRLQEKYHALVGSKLSDIQEAEAKEREANEPARVRSVDHAIPVSSSSVPATATSREEVTLDEVEESQRQSYNRQLGLNMSREEWAAIRDGKPLADGSIIPTDF